MTRFTKNRFLEICRGERPGDFGILGNGFHMFWPETLATWVAGRAPKPLASKPSGLGNDVSDVVSEFFQFDETRLLWEVHSGMDAGTVMLDFHGASFQDHAFLVCPPFEPEVVEEDDKSLTFISRAGIKEKVLKAESFNMPMWLEHPVKDELPGTRSRSAWTPPHRNVIRKTGAHSSRW